MQKNVSLKPYNTFGIDVKADWLAEIESVEQLLTILDDTSEMKKLILGSGSNVLFINDFDGMVLLNRIKGKKIISETDDEIIL
jgi:UDP-N-acetylmuramate dehydrogenase